MQNIRGLYHSPNGDRWLLARDPDTGHVFVKHQANLPSGGHMAEIEIGVFLNQGHGPEHQSIKSYCGSSAHWWKKRRLGEKRVKLRRRNCRKEICRQRHRDEDRRAYSAPGLGRRYNLTGYRLWVLAWGCRR
jgi:hypothetical protein